MKKKKKAGGQDFSSLPTPLHLISPAFGKLAPMAFINQLRGNVLLTLGHPDLRQVCATSAHAGAGLLHLHGKKLECLCSKAVREGWEREGEE